MTRVHVGSGFSRTTVGSGVSRTRSGAAVLAVALLAMSDAAAQAPSPQRPSGSGMIRGRIFAVDTGRPLRRAQVAITGAGLERRTANTGLDGRYEFKDLPEGRYTVTVSRSGYLSLQYGQRRPLEQARPLQLGDAQTIEDVDFSLPRAGAISGRVLDDAGEPIAGAMVWAMRPLYVDGRRQLVVASSGESPFIGTDDTGYYRVSGLVPGTYYVRAITRETWIGTNGGRRVTLAFAPTFFPGTPRLEDAQLTQVGAGQQLRDMDFALVPERAATLAGTAVDSRGQPLAGRSVGLSLRFSNAGGGGGAMNMGSAPVGADGSFALRNVPPGEYELSATTGNPGTGDGETARMRVLVTGADIDSLQLVTSAGWSMTGRLVTDDGSVPDFLPGRVTVRGALLSSVPMTGVGSGEVADDWTFLVKAIIGPARLAVTVPDGWMVAAVRHEGRDVTGAVMEAASGAVIPGVEVMVTNRVTRVAGQLTDDRGAPTMDGAVIVFAEDQEKWSDAFVRAARPDQQGRYEIRGLPPGDYLAAAVAYAESGIWNDPEYLELLRRDARRFTLSDGGSHALTLSVGAQR